MNKEEFQESLKQIIKTTLIEFDPPFNLSIPVNYFRVKGNSRNPFYPGDENILSKFQSISEVSPVRWKHPVIIHFYHRGKLTNGMSNFGLPVIVIDNEALYSNCKTDKNVVNRWNKAVLEHYRSFSSDEYKTHTKYFIEWFELKKEIVIDSNEYKAIPLLYELPKKGSLLKDKKPDEKVGEKHSNYNDLGVVSQAIVEILATTKKIKHNKIKELLKTNYPELNVEYTQSLSQTFRDKARIFYKDEIGHHKGYWYLKRPDLYKT